MAWDGSFDKSKYRETGNIVNDVIENNGILLHEATPDGYIHEIVDRGAYITDDYYFPQRIPDKKPHIHYELRSTGEIRINKKDISKNKVRGEGKMAHRVKARVLEKGADGTIIRGAVDESVKDGEKLKEIGKQFVRDKENLEAALDRVENARLSDADKQKMKAELNLAIERIQEQYERDVEEEEKRLEVEFLKQREVMQENADELERQAADLRSIKVEVSETDATDAADAAVEKQREFEEMMADAGKKLDLQIQQMNMIQRNMRARRLSGR